MKTIRHLAVASLICVLTPAALNLGRAQTSSSSSSDSKQDQSEKINTDSSSSSARPHRISQAELKRKVTKINKASSFIGMKVENLQNQDLGKVEDLVFDPDTGKISYAVISVGGFLGMNEKYIAVPLHALTPAPGEDHLMLDADKQRLERAPGFAKNKWPDLDTPAWSAATGFSGGTTGTAGTSEPNPNAVGQPGKSGQEQGTASGQSDQKHYEGKVTQLDQAARTIKVQGDNGEKTFAVDNNAQIRAGNDNDAKINDLKVGSNVTIDYADKNGAPVAKVIEMKDSGKKDGQP
jgi:sporulation protein YlmC with PRC-barrel domain